MSIPLFLPWLCLLSSVLPAGLPRQAAPGAGLATWPSKPALAMRELFDLPYVENGHERQRLDLYLPQDAAGSEAERQPRPLVIWVHGGSWETGSKHDCPATPLVARGYAVASVGYRLSSQAVFPAQIEDCKAAVRWLRAHSGEYGIDPARIGAWGGSAGGHLVALLGTTAGTRQFDVGGNLDRSSAVRCVLDWFGPVDFLHWGAPPVDPLYDTMTSPVAHLLGGTVQTHREIARTASPVFYVDKSSAPFLIMHGERDPTVPVQQSQELHTALQKAGVESTLTVLPGAAHGGPAFTRPENLLLMTRFFDRHLHPAKR